MGRKPSEDAIYAKELGMENRLQGRRLITRLGGANKLRSLTPEVRKLLLVGIGQKRSPLWKVK